jgi:hypothetical protein
MKVGDLVQINGPHWHLAKQPTPGNLEGDVDLLVDDGKIGIIINDLGGLGKAFKVLISDGKIRSKLRSQLCALNIHDILNENWRD